MHILKSIKQKYDGLRPRAKGAVWFICAVFFQNALSIIATPIYSRLFTLEEAGNYSLYYTWYNLFSIVCTFNITGAAINALLHDCENDSEQKNTLVSSMILNLISTAIVFAVLFCLFGFGFGFSNLSIPYLVLILISILVDIPVKLYISYSKYNNKYFKCCMLIFTQVFASFALSLLVFYLMPDKVAGRVVGKEIGYLLILFFSIVCIFKGSSLKFKNGRWGKILRVSLPLVIHYLAQNVFFQSNKLVIEQFNGTEEVAIFSLAYNATSIMTLVIGTIYEVLTPWMFKQIDLKNRSNLFSVNKVLSVLFMWLIIIFAFGSHLVVLILGGSQYTSSVQLVPILSITLVCVLFYTQIIVLEMHQKKTISVSMITIICMAINIGLTILFVQMLSSLGAAIASAITYFIMGLFHGFAVMRLERKIDGMKWFFSIKKLWFYYVAAIACCILAYFLNEFTMVMYILFGVAFVGAGIHLFLIRKDIKHCLKSREQSNNPSLSAENEGKQ